MVTFDLKRIAAPDLISHTPLSVFPGLIPIRSYNVRGIRIVVGDSIVAKMHIPEQVCVVFLDGLPPLHRSSLLDEDGIFREQRGQGGGIVVVPCLFKFFSKHEKLPTSLRVGRICLLG